MFGRRRFLYFPFRREQKKTGNEPTLVSPYKRRPTARPNGRSVFSVTNLGSHSSLFSTELTSSFTGFFGSHDILRLALKVIDVCLPSDSNDAKTRSRAETFEKWFRF
jgi:hypothetical protein